MKKIAAFLVDKRFFLLGIVLCLTVVCGIFTFQVKINTDMTKYLPDDSSMKIGMDLMEEEFPDTEIQQTIRVMFRDLKDSEKASIREKLSKIPYVESVSYEETGEDYNRDAYTLYVLNTVYDYSSPEERSIEAAVWDTFSDYTLWVKNDDTASSDIPPWLLITAVSLLMVILFVMCRSWTEPFLFMAAIGMAVVINLGTNIFLGSVSTVTFSIAAVLQLVLSMDYSIILMNRYRQETQKNPNNAEAMKTALRQAFSSIASSGMTTVVGLLMLVFMSFKIGMDLGIVLAKGVLISMLCVFSVLPCLILLFDKLIRKTAKRDLRIPVKGAAAFSYRLRRPIAIGFAVLFLSSCFLQGTAETVYTLQYEDPIADVFPTNNTIVMLYENKEEEAVPGLTDWLESDSHTKSVISYPTTLGRPYTSSQLYETLQDMGNETEIDPSVLNILYYDYYTNGKISPMSMGEFIRFLSENIEENDLFSGYLSQDMKDNLDFLEKFSDAEALQKPMDASELASFFQMKEEDVKNLLLYYYMEKGGADAGTLSLSTFADFLIEEVAKEEAYASMLDAQSLSQLESLSVFTDADRMTTPLTYTELADLLGIDAAEAKLLYVYYYSLSKNYEPDSMTLPAFTQLMEKEITQNPLFSSYMNGDSLKEIQMLSRFTDTKTIQKQMTAKELSAALGIEESTIDQLLTLYYGNLESQGKSMTLPEFTGFLVEHILTDKSYSGYFDETTKAQLTAFHQLASASASRRSFTAGELAGITGMEESQIQLIFLFYGMTAGETPSSMTLPDFFGFVSGNPSITGSLPPETAAQLEQTNMLVQAAASGRTFTAKELASYLSMEEDLVNQIFVLYYGSRAENKTMSLKQLTDYLLEVASAGGAASSYMDAATIKQLRLLQTIMDSSIRGKKYSYTALSQLLSMDAASMKLIFTYGEASRGNTSGWKLSPQTAVNFLSAHKNELGSALGNQNLSMLEIARKLINGAVAGTQYTPQELGVLLGMDSAQLEQLFLLYQSRHGNTENWKISIQTFVSFIANNVLKNDALAENLDENTAEQVKGANTLIEAVVSEKLYSPSEMSSLLSGMQGLEESSSDLDTNSLELLYLYKDSLENSDPEWKLSIEELFRYLSQDVLTDPRFEKFLDEDYRKEITDMETQLEDGIRQLKGENYSLLMLTSSLPSESPETTEFLKELHAQCSDRFSGKYYLIGSSPMNYEMQQSFGGEMLLITLLTALSIFLVVALTFRSITIPLILVLIVQCGVYLTMSANGILGYSMYYLAILIVQCILMGATVDYGILFTNYYRENRRHMGIREALESAYEGSIHTILTSGLIMILVTGIIGFSPADPTIGQICQTISIGALAATLLILFVLPGLLAAFDRFVSKKEKIKE